MGIHPICLRAYTTYHVVNVPKRESARVTINEASQKLRYLQSLEPFAPEIVENNEFDFRQHFDQENAAAS